MVLGWTVPTFMAWGFKAEGNLNRIFESTLGGMQSSDGIREWVLGGGVAVFVPEFSNPCQ